MAPRTSTTGDNEDWMAKAKIASVPTPSRQPTRDYSPKGADMPGLNEMVWKSYQTGETMVVGCPPDKVDEVRSQLLKAKNYLNYLHRDDEVAPDIRGVGAEKTDLAVVRPEDFDDVKLRTAYKAAIPIGWVGVRFTARPPLLKGGAVTRANAVKRASEPSAAKRKQATVREISSAAPKRGRAAAKKSSDGDVPPVAFSG
jgi:hypothetical protein